MHEVLDNRLGGLNLPRKSVVSLTDRPDMTLDVYNNNNITVEESTSKQWVRSRYPLERFSLLIETKRKSRKLFLFIKIAEDK